MKKLAILFLCGFIFLQIGFGANKNAVESMQEEGILIGDNMGNLRLKDNITRAEFLKVLILENYTESALYAEAIEPNFEDISKTDWYYIYFGLASRKNMYSGQKKVMPNEQIDLKEILKSIAIFQNKEIDENELRDNYSKYLDKYFIKNVDLSVKVKRRDAFGLIKDIFNDFNVDDSKEVEPKGKEVIKVR